MKEHWNFLFKKEAEESIHLRKRLQKLIAEAPERAVGDYDILMLVSNGKYDGFFGVNGYDHILILGYIDKDKQWYKAADYPDIFKIDLKSFNGVVTFDINSAYGVPTFAFGSPIHIENDGLSTLVGTVKNRGKVNENV